MFIQPKGSRASQVWVLVDYPYSTDAEKGYVFSGGMGYVFDKMMREAGLNDYFVTAYKPDLQHQDAYANLIGELNQYKPPIIIPLDDLGKILCDELDVKSRRASKGTSSESEIYKYAGSLLISNRLHYPHYVLPTFGPSVVMAQYKLRDQVIHCDLEKAAGELEFYKKHGTLNPLPKRECKIQFDCFDELLSIIDGFCSAPIISNDIETVYPKGGTRPSQLYKKHPGLPITIGLAPSKDFGISFDVFREKSSETVELWRHLDKLFRTVPQLGQNFFGFDLNFYEMLGFRLRAEECKDTMIRHHVLFPELPHKLQFLGRQYTREPFWKDEGHQWSPKQMNALKRYNCLDVCCTYEIYEAQEIELKERGLE